MTSFRFVHSADIHLDSPLRGLSSHGDLAAERIRTATREALEQLVALVIEEEAAFLIIAGDLYDGDWRDYQTGLFFSKQMGRLSEADIPVFLLHGNHDAESQLTRRLILPPNVREFPSRKPATYELGDLGVAVHGQSFKDRDITDNLVPGYPEAIRDLARGDWEAEKPLHREVTPGGKNSRPVHETVDLLGDGSCEPLNGLIGPGSDPWDHCKGFQFSLGQGAECGWLLFTREPLNRK